MPRSKAGSQHVADHLSETILDRSSRRLAATGQKSVAAPAPDAGDPLSRRGLPQSAVTAVMAAL